MLHTFTKLALLTAFTVVTPSQLHASKAHVHGLASLTLAIDGPTIDVVLVSPAESIVGFEHKPNTATQEKTLKEALEKLKAQTAAWLTLPASRKCSNPQPAAIKQSFAQDPHDQDGFSDDHHDDHHHEHAKKGGGSSDTHSEITATWRYSCASPLKKGDEISVVIPAPFKRIEQLNVQVLTDHGQQQLKASRSQKKLRL